MIAVPSTDPRSPFDDAGVRPAQHGAPPDAVLGFDAGWGGTGWTIATEGGPLLAGHETFGGRTWRETALLEWLRGPMESEILHLRLHGQIGRVRVVIERLPWHYSSGNARKTAGGHVIKPNPTRTVYGLSAIAHLILGWGCRPTWGYPWLIPPNADKRGGEPGWRDWYPSLARCKGRAAKKRGAVELVKLHGWGAMLIGHAPVDDEGNGAQGDVAESVLIAVGAAKREQQAPAGPAKWRKNAAAT